MKKCFVICPIGEENSEIRKRSDQIFNYVIKPITEEFGYEAVRAHEISEPGIITRQIIQKIIDAPLVIADLTDRNPNVFYELAIRHVIRKPLVQMIEKGEDIPFDIAATRIISIDRTDLDSVENAKEELKRQIRSVEEDDTKVDNPISVAIELQGLRSSGDPEERLFGAILTKLEEVASNVSKIENYIEIQQQRSQRHSLAKDYPYYIQKSPRLELSNKDELWDCLNKLVKTTDEPPREQLEQSVEKDESEKKK